MSSTKDSKIERSTLSVGRRRIREIELSKKSLLAEVLNLYRKIYISQDIYFPIETFQRKSHWTILPILC